VVDEAGSTPLLGDVRLLFNRAQKVWQQENGGRIGEGDWSSDLVLGAKKKHVGGLGLPIEKKDSYLGKTARGYKASRRSWEENFAAEKRPSIRTAGYENKKGCWGEIGG